MLPAESNVDIDAQKELASETPGAAARRELVKIGRWR